MNQLRNALPPGHAYNPAIRTRSTILESRGALRPGFSVCLLLALLALVTPANGLNVLNSNQLVFVNIDHAPMGACSTFNYGFKGQPCGITNSTPIYPGWPDAGGGVLFALSGPSGLQLLPFVTATTQISPPAAFFPDASIQRSLTPCSDDYVIA